MSLGIAERLGFKPTQKLKIVAEPETIREYEQRAREQGLKVKIDAPTSRTIYGLLQEADPKTVKGCHEDGDARGTGPDVIDALEKSALSAVQTEAIEALAARPEFKADINEVRRFLFESFANSPNSDPRDPNLPYEGVVWHSTVSSSWRTNVMNVVRFLLDKKNKVSYNWVIPSHKIKVAENVFANKILTIVDKTRVAWHAGKSVYINPKTGQRHEHFEVNKRTLGIAIDFSNSSLDNITQHHFNGMVAAALEAERLHGIPLDIRYHKLHLEVAVPAGRKKDIIRSAVVIENVLAEARRIKAEIQNPIEPPADSRLGAQQISVPVGNLRERASTKSAIKQKVPIGTPIWVQKLDKNGEAVQGNKVWGGLSGGDETITSWAHASIYKPRPINQIARAQAAALTIADRAQDSANNSTRKVIDFAKEKTKQFRRAA